MFARPLDFDAAAFVLESLATIPWGWPIEVLLELSLSEAQRRLAPDLGTLEEVPGGVVLRTQADNLDWFARLLVEVGCPFRIEHPQELRATVLRLAREVSRLARRAPRRPALRGRKKVSPGVLQTVASFPAPPGVGVVQTR